MVILEREGKMFRIAVILKRKKGVYVRSNIREKKFFVPVKSSDDILLYSYIKISLAYLVYIFPYMICQCEYLLETLFIT